MSSSYCEDTSAAPSVVHVRTVVEEACRRLAHTTEPITAESRLAQDLGFDSLRRLELAVVLESYFDLGEMDMDQALSLATVGDVVDLVSTAYHPQCRR